MSDLEMWPNQTNEGLNHENFGYIQFPFPYSDILQKIKKLKIEKSEISLNYSFKQGA